MGEEVGTFDAPPPPPRRTALVSGPSRTGLARTHRASHNPS